MRTLMSICLALVLCLVLAAPALAGERCLRVQLDGTIKLRPKNPAATAGQAGNAMTSCRTNGKFHIELIFPEKGGPVRSQNNWVAISGFDCPPGGCLQQPHPGFADPRSFTLKATAEPSGPFSYTVSFHLAQLPPPSPITITIQCQGAPADVSDHGANYRQLMLPWHLTKMVLGSKLNQAQTKHHPEMDLPPFLKALVEWEELATLVPCSNFQY